MYQYGYDEHMLRRQLEKYFKEHNMKQATETMAYAWEKHRGMTRMNGQPFIIHPLFVAVYGIVIGANTEDQICIALLHDICEDCNVPPSELPANERVRESVGLLTLDYGFEEGDRDEEKRRKKLIVKSEAFARLIRAPEPLICKGIDRYHSLMTAEDLPEKNITKNVLETHRMLLPVIYNALTIETYEKYYSQLYALSINLRSLNDLLAMKHGIMLNTMS